MKKTIIFTIFHLSLCVLAAETIHIPAEGVIEEAPMTYKDQFIFFVNQFLTPLSEEEEAKINSPLRRSPSGDGILDGSLEAQHRYKRKTIQNLPETERKSEAERFARQEIERLQEETLDKEPSALLRMAGTKEKSIPVKKEKRLDETFLEELEEIEAPKRGRIIDDLGL
jgi:hypothetical protein